MSSAVSVKPVTLKFSAIRAGVADFGTAITPLLQMPAQDHLRRRRPSRLAISITAGSVSTPPASPRPSGQ